MNHSRIAIIGAGRVGTTIAYALMLKNIARQILLVDVNTMRCKGEILDLEDALSFCDTATIETATLAQAAQADIIIITAGVAQKPGQSRSDLAQVNKKILDEIVKGLVPINPHAIIIVVTNPLDVLAFHLHTKKLVPDQQLFGSGTFLDSIRLTNLIAKKFNVPFQAVQAWMLGEHGDTQFAAWSLTTINGIPIEQLSITPNELDTLAQEARHKAYEIIDCKGSTFYGIASCVMSLCESIILDQRKIFPVSHYIAEYDTFMSTPCIVEKKGIERIFSLSLNKSEKEKLEQSARAIQKI